MSEIDQAAPPRATRRSKERRAIIIVNLALLGVAALVAAPSSVRAVVSGVEEERECAKARAILAGTDLRAIEQSGDVAVETEDAFVALDKLAQAVDSAHFEALQLQSLVATCHDLGDARAKLRAAEQKLGEVNTMSQDLARRAQANLELHEKLATLCMNDPAAQADCVALSMLPQGAMGPTSTSDALASRLADFELHHQALEALTIHAPPMKALVLAQLHDEDELIAVMHDYLPKLKAIEHDATDEDALRRKVFRDHLKVKQQLTGIRLYCDAPVEPRAGGKP